jgi:hypothetical protein
VTCLIFSFLSLVRVTSSFFFFYPFFFFHFLFLSLSYFLRFIPPLFRVSFSSYTLSLFLLGTLLALLPFMLSSPVSCIEVF